MNSRNDSQLTSQGALRLEYGIIGLGIFALLLIFQPFSLTLFTCGAMFVVVAGLINNLLPMAQPGTKVRSIVTVTMVVAMVFFIVLLVAILSAHLFGVFFLKPPDPNTTSGKVQLAAAPWYLHGFTWSIAAIASALIALVTLRSRKSP